MQRLQQQADYFSQTSHKGNCLACGSTLANPTGGKADIKGVVVGVVE